MPLSKLLIDKMNWSVKHHQHFETNIVVRTSNAHDVWKSCILHN